MLSPPVSAGRGPRKGGASYPIASGLIAALPWSPSSAARDRAACEPGAPARPDSPLPTILPQLPSPRAAPADSQPRSAQTLRSAPPNPRHTLQTRTCRTDARHSRSTSYRRRGPHLPPPPSRRSLASCFRPATLGTFAGPSRDGSRPHAGLAPALPGPSRRRSRDVVSTGHANVTIESTDSYAFQCQCLRQEHRWGHHLFQLPSADDG